MSLYIGNLSARTRKDQLEHAFRRFGRCNVELKRQGYGFVVYDFPVNADKALKALQGRNICGEQLTLTWSNKQPRQFQRFPRGAGTYELQQTRDSDTVGYVRRKVNANGWSNFDMDNDRRYKSVDVHSEERRYHQDDFKGYVEEEKDHRGHFADDSGGLISNLEDNGRWGEAIHDPSIDNGNDNDVEFNRYEPYHGYDRKHDENNDIGYSGGSPAGNSEEDMGSTQIGEATSNYPNDSKYQKICYRCGDPGHIMRNCPKGYASHRKYNRLDSGQNVGTDKKHRVGDERSKFEYSSRGKLWSSRDTLSSRQQRNEQKVFPSQHHQMLPKNEVSPVAKETDKPRRKKRSGKEMEAPKRSKAKKARKSTSSSLRLDFIETRSGSMSRSSKFLPSSSSRSRSCSLSSSLRSSKSHSPAARSPNTRRSISPRSCSLSSSLRYSKSHSPAARSPNTRRSISPTSLSVSSDEPILSSANKIQLKSKGSSIDDALESLDHLGVQGQQIGSNLKLMNDECKDASIAVNEDAALCTRVVVDMERDQYVQEGINAKHILLGATNEVITVTKPLPDESTFTAGNLSSDRLKEAEGFQQSGILVMDDMPAESSKPAAETDINCHSKCSATISSEEMCKVLEHYGLDLPDEDEKNLTVDAFFGSARLWPWHIIHYRRLKKGPIATENYARRVAQNQEFGIVDKYIRSSSGWGELNPENS